jgi:NitT/TauT family transport system permease protein
MLGFITLLRVVVLVALATIIWVPVGVYVGLRRTEIQKISTYVI